jgi:RES domain-containing protein
VAKRVSPRAIALKGRFYRMVSMKHKNEILDIQGSILAGGRYNPPHEFGALYLGETKEVCKAERMRKSKTPFPMVIGEIEISLNKTLDLTDDKILEQLGINKKDLLRDMGDEAYDYKVTRNIARRVRREGIEGLIVPSVTGKGKNLVIFMENIKSESGSSVRVLSAEAVEF